MTKAEEAANKAYPPKIEEHQKVMGGTITFDCNRQPREFFRQGYEQAEKDLIEKAVTWWCNNLVESEPTKGHYISAFKKYMENKEDKK